jgi:hypothetical protein
LSREVKHQPEAYQVPSDREHNDSFGKDKGGSMREKIIFVLRTDVHSGEYLTPQYWVQRRRTLADRILFFLCEEIGKVENPFVRAGFNYPPECVTAFERCRQDILAMLQKEAP